MAYCSNCGNPIKEDSAFCDKCGTKIIKSEQETITKNNRNSKLHSLFGGIKEAVEVSAPYIKSIGKFLIERGQIVAENLEEEGSLFDWNPPNIDPLKIDLPRGLSVDSFNDELIFGSKSKPNKRPYIPKALRVLLYKRDKGICGICDEKVDWHDYNIAHDTAHSKGGKLTKSNLFIAHPLCNRSQGTRSKREIQNLMKS